MSEREISMPTIKDYQDNYQLAYKKGIYSIDENSLVLHGGGDFYHAPENPDLGHVPDEETQGRARELATELNKTILGIEGAWWGYSSWTPHPGDVSIFRWTDAPTEVMGA
jgi:hypothetical protein